MPAGVTVHARAWGGGGGLGTYLAGAVDYCGSGGGGGAFAAADFAAGAGGTVTVVVGGGVPGGTPTSGAWGGDSSVSYGSLRVLADGGRSGYVVGTTESVPGGQASDSIGDVRVSGGDGAPPVPGGSLPNCSSGAGGAGASSGGNVGGAGGASLTNPTQQDGNPGQVPGGGGGGARGEAGTSSHQTGGAGASGGVVLSWTTAPTTYTVSPSVNTGSGTVTCSPGTVDSGGDSTCQAVPATGWQVSGWIGACAAAGASEYCHLTNIQSNQSSTVNFETVPTYTVSASVGSGAGHGTVACNPSTVNEGGKSICDAVPDSGWRVSGWTGACAEAGAGTSEFCQLTNIQEDQLSSVNFALERRVNPVPALSFWGLGLLSLLLLGAGWVRRR